MLLAGQMYIIARHYLKLLFYASEIAFFQGSLAHAAYTAAPAVIWALLTTMWFGFGWLTPVVGPVMMWVAYRVWTRGIDRYQGAGG